MIFESDEFIFGVEPRTIDWVQYKSKLIVKDGGKKPVSLHMTFVPPHPFAVNMPDEHSISAESITAAYAKVFRFFEKFGIQFKG